MRAHAAAKCNRAITPAAHLGQIEAAQVVQRKRHSCIVQAIRPRQHLQCLDESQCGRAGVRCSALWLDMEGRCSSGHVTNTTASYQSGGRSSSRSCNLPAPQPLTWRYSGSAASYCRRMR